MDEHFGDDCLVVVETQARKYYSKYFGAKRVSDRDRHYACYQVLMDTWEEVAALGCTKKEARIMREALEQQITGKQEWT